MNRSKRQGDKYHRITKYQRDVEKLASILKASDDVQPDTDKFLKVLDEMLIHAIAELPKSTTEAAQNPDKTDIPHWFAKLIIEIQRLLSKKSGS